MSLAQKDAQDEAKSEQQAASADGGGGAADGGGGSGVGARRGNYYYAHGTVATDPNFSRPEKITAEEAARRQAALNGVGAVPGEHPGEHGARAGGDAAAAHAAPSPQPPPPTVPGPVTPDLPVRRHRCLPTACVSSEHVLARTLAGGGSRRTAADHGGGGKEGEAQLQV